MAREPIMIPVKDIIKDLDSLDGYDNDNSEHFGFVNNWDIVQLIKKYRKLQYGKKTLL
jgi:hypothetical protein